MSNVIPHRKDVAVAHEEQARLFLRGFNPKKYSTFYARIYDADAYLEQVGIETICELIEHGNSIFNIAKHLDISVRTLRSWIGKSAYRKAQIQEAYTFAGDAYAFKAEETLLDSRFSTKEQISVAGKLADHYRWMASKLNKEQYGEAKKEDANSGKPPLVFNVSIGGAPAHESEMKTVRPTIEGTVKALGITLTEEVTK
jgi:hypothetical protein